MTEDPNAGHAHVCHSGLVLPHIGRMLVGPDHRPLLPATALFGRFFVLGLDDFTR